MTRIRALVPKSGAWRFSSSVGVDFAVSAQQALRWGGDKAGGAPFIYEEEGKGTIGFEWELADYLAKEIGRTPQFVQLDWDNLPETLERGNIDIALNGMEFRTEWEEKYPSTLPYFIFSLRLIARVDDSSIRSWDDLRSPEGKPKKRVGVLRGSMAERYLERRSGFHRLLCRKEVDETLPVGRRRRAAGCDRARLADGFLLRAKRQAAETSRRGRAGRTGLLRCSDAKEKRRKKPRRPLTSRNN